MQQPGKIIRLTAHARIAPSLVTFGTITKASRATAVVDPRHYKVEFENERVRVVRIKYGPGEKSVMHSHPESVAVFLTDAHAKFTYPDGRTEDINANVGTVQHMDAFTHLPESLSNTPFEVIQVEWKR